MAKIKVIKEVEAKIKEIKEKREESLEEDVESVETEELGEFVNGEVGVIESRGANRGAGERVREVPREVSEQSVESIVAPAPAREEEREQVRGYEESRGYWEEAVYKNSRASETERMAGFAVRREIVPEREIFAPVRGRSASLETSGLPRDAQSFQRGGLVEAEGEKYKFGKEEERKKRKEEFF
jgi:hypothetical protein